MLMSVLDAVPALLLKLWVILAGRSGRAERAHKRSVPLQCPVAMAEREGFGHLNPLTGL